MYWFDIIKIDEQTATHLKMNMIEIILLKNNIKGYDGSLLYEVKL